jgi:putative ABC transport system ATP-binding protein
MNFRGKNLGVVFQNFNLINTFTVKQNLEIAVSAIDKKKSISFFNLLDRVGLANKSHIKVANLSIGEKQRLAVARAFIGDPKWVFCDEPTSSLDDKNANIIANLIKEESLRCKASLVLITHDNRIQSLINFSQILRLGEEL